MGAVGATGLGTVSSIAVERVAIFLDLAGLSDIARWANNATAVQAGFTGVQLLIEACGIPTLAPRARCVGLAIACNIAVQALGAGWASGAATVLIGLRAIDLCIGARIDVASTRDADIARGAVGILRTVLANGTRETETTTAVDVGFPHIQIAIPAGIWVAGASVGLATRGCVVAGGKGRVIDAGVACLAVCGLLTALKCIASGALVATAIRAGLVTVFFLIVAT